MPVNEAQMFDALAKAFKNTKPNPAVPSYVPKPNSDEAEMLQEFARLVDPAFKLSKPGSPDAYAIMPDDIKTIASYADAGRLAAWQPASTIITNADARNGIALAAYLNGVLRNALTKGTGMLDGVVSAKAEPEDIAQSFVDLMNASGATTLKDLAKTVRLTRHFADPAYGNKLSTKPNTWSRVTEVAKIGSQQRGGTVSAVDMLGRLETVEAKATASGNAEQLVGSVLDGRVEVANAEMLVQNEVDPRASPDDPADFKYDR